MTVCSMSATGSLNHIGYVAVMAHALSRFPESGMSTASVHHILDLPRQMH